MSGAARHAPRHAAAKVTRVVEAVTLGTQRGSLGGAPVFSGATVLGQAVIAESTGAGGAVHAGPAEGGVVGLVDDLL